MSKNRDKLIAAIDREIKKLDYHSKYSSHLVDLRNRLSRPQRLTKKMYENLAWIMEKYQIKTIN